MKRKIEESKICGCQGSYMCPKHQILWDKVLECYKRRSQSNWKEWLNAVNEYKK